MPRSPPTAPVRHGRVRARTFAAAPLAPRPIDHAARTHGTTATPRTRRAAPTSPLPPCAESTVRRSAAIKGPRLARTAPRHHSPLCPHSLAPHSPVRRPEGEHATAAHRCHGRARSRSAGIRGRPRSRRVPLSSFSLFLFSVDARTSPPSPLVIPCTGTPPGAAADVLDPWRTPCSPPTNHTAPRPTTQPPSSHDPPPPIAAFAADDRRRQVASPGLPLSLLFSVRREEEDGCEP